MIVDTIQAFYRESVKKHLQSFLSYLRKDLFVEHKNDTGGVTYYDVATFKQNASSTGAILFLLPITKNGKNFMANYTFEWYNYAANTSGSITICGYTYFDDNWIHRTIYGNTGTNTPFNKITLSRIEDTNRWCIAIGDVTDTWNYISITLSKVEVYYANQEGFNTGWEVEQITTFDALDAANFYEHYLVNSSWVVDTYQNTFRHYGGTYGNVRVNSRNNRVVIDGLAKCDSQNINGKTIFVLPEEFRPRERLIFIQMASASPVRVDITADGIVTCVTSKVATWVTLSGIVFDSNHY